MMMLRLSRRTHLDCSASDTPTTEHTHPSTAWQWKNVLDFYFFLPHFSLAVRSPTWAVLPVCPSEWAPSSSLASWSPAAAQLVTTKGCHCLITTHREYPSDPFMLKSEATSTICLVFYFFPFPCQLVGLLSPATIGGPASQESSVPAAVSPAAPVRPVPAPANRRKPPWQTCPWRLQPWQFIRPSASLTPLCLLPRFLLLIALSQLGNFTMDLPTVIQSMMVWEVNRCLGNARINSFFGCGSSQIHSLPISNLLHNLTKTKGCCWFYHLPFIDTEVC